MKSRRLETSRMQLWYTTSSPFFSALRSWLPGWLLPGTGVGEATPTCGVFCFVSLCGSDEKRAVV